MQLRNEDLSVFQGNIKHAVIQVYFLDIANLS